MDASPQRVRRVQGSWAPSAFALVPAWALAYGLGLGMRACCLPSYGGKRRRGANEIPMPGAGFEPARGFPQGLLRALCLASSTIPAHLDARTARAVTAQSRPSAPVAHPTTAATNTIARPLIVRDRARARGRVGPRASARALHGRLTRPGPSRSGTSIQRYAPASRTSRGTRARPRSRAAPSTPSQD
jgi:hypothetical protein